MIFVDTSAWYARYTPRDVYHVSARGFLQNNRDALVTTDYVIDETLTLLKVRGNYQRALYLGRRLFARKLARIVWVEKRDVEAAWKVFEQFQDKEWSFTDCVSYVIIERLGMQEAFAFDDHFRQFGMLNVVP